MIHSNDYSDVGFELEHSIGVGYRVTYIWVMGVELDVCGWVCVEMVVVVWGIGVDVSVWYIWVWVVVVVCDREWSVVVVLLG